VDASPVCADVGATVDVFVAGDEPRCAKLMRVHSVLASSERKKPTAYAACSVANNAKFAPDSVEQVHRLGCVG